MHPPAPALLRWYDRHRRTLAWRGERDPYRIWLSEVMLQQTTAAAVAPRYARFLARFPDVAALAAAPWEDVAAEWAGLGYYARARNLHAAARAVAGRVEAGLGAFPDTEAGLRALPGVGAYTAAAVAAIAFGRAVVPVDGNVERVTARLFAVAAPLPGARPRLTALARGFAVQPEVAARPGDFAQALFDLGATICTPRRPACALCPWRGECAARAAGLQDTLPARTAKAARPLRYGTHFLLLDGDGRLLLERRPERGLLGGMAGLPGTPWREGAPWTEAEALPCAPWPPAPSGPGAPAPGAAGADPGDPGPAWTPLPGEARHGFTHMELRMRLLTARVPAGTPAPAPAGGGGPLSWLPAAAARAALPTAMRRLLPLAEAAGLLPPAPAPTAPALASSPTAVAPTPPASRSPP